MKKYEFEDMKYRGSSGYAWNLRYYWEIEFPNGYGASVISQEGGYELAVIVDGQIVYNTPITKNVVYCVDKAHVVKLLNNIARLESSE